MTSKEYIENQLKTIQETKEYLLTSKRRNQKAIDILNENENELKQALKELTAFEILKKNNLFVGKSKYSETGYFVTINTDIEEQEYNAIADALPKKEVA